MPAHRDTPGERGGMSMHVRWHRRGIPTPIDFMIEGCSTVFRLLIPDACMWVATAGVLGGHDVNFEGDAERRYLQHGIPTAWRYKLPNNEWADSPTEKGEFSVSYVQDAW